MRTLNYFDKDFYLLTLFFIFFLAIKRKRYYILYKKNTFLQKIIIFVKSYFNYKNIFYILIYYKIFYKEIINLLCLSTTNNLLLTKK